MADVVVVTPNPAIDVTYEVALNLPGSTNRVLRAERRPGGKGLNVSHVLQTLGVSTTSVLPVGGRNGQWLIEQLGHRPGRVRATVVDAETRTTVTVTDEVAHPTVYSEAGLALDTAERAAFTAAIRAELPGAQALVIAGSFAGGIGSHDLSNWIHDAQQQGAFVVVDCSGFALLDAARAGADIVKANADEVKESTGAISVELGIRALLDLGARGVVVSRGGDGIEAVFAHTSLSSPAVPNISGNPTGAGDAATAGLVAALLAKAAPADALCWASAAGGAAVRQQVAGEIDLADFAHFRSQLIAERVTTS